MKNIPQYKGKYAITQDGKVWSYVSNRYLTLHKGKKGKGYWVVSLVGLGKNKQRIKTHYVHRLIADVYIPKVKGKNSVNHINGNSLDNSVENLEWCTQKENVRHAWKTGLSTPRFGENHPCTKLSNIQVSEIRKKIDYKYGTMTKLAKEYGVSISLVSLIGKNHRYV